MLLLLAACSGSTETSPQVLPTPLSATAPASAQDGDGVVATWKGGSLTYGAVQSEVANDLVALEIEYLQNRYQLESQAVSELATMQVLETEAASRSLSLEELLKVEVEDKVAMPTESEIQEFYPVLRRQLGGADYETAKPQVEMALVQRRQGERMGVYLAEMEAKYELTTQLPYPDMPRLDVGKDDDPMRGDPEATVTIVEFADYNCGYCRKIYPTLVELVEKDYAGKVNLVYRDYPLSGGARGLEPTIAANCADAQGKYWEMHHELMIASNYSEAALMAYARAAQLDEDAFAECIANPEAQIPEILADFEAGRSVGVSGTPAFFINGIPLSGAVPKDQFVTIIERELAK